MELLGNLKDKVSKAQNKEEAKSIIEKAGMRLTDAELDMVAGGTPVTGRTARDDRGYLDKIENASRGPLIP